MSRLLFDSSSLIKALKQGRVDLLARNYIHWLTIYEVLNAIWKETCFLKTIPEDKVIAFAEILKQVTGLMKILDPKGLEEDMLKTAIQRGITAYDASYIVLAMKHGLTLVTEDSKLRAKARGLVETTSLDELSASLGSIRE